MGMLIFDLIVGIVVVRFRLPQPLENLKHTIDTLNPLLFVLLDSCYSLEQLGDNLQRPSLQSYPSLYPLDPFRHSPQSHLSLP
jgi:hypothetical protein